MVRRALDVAGSLVMLVLTAPAMASIALAVLLDSRRPILFRQTRIGRGGAPFELLKFRSMTALREGPLVTVAGDGRITRAGRVLRRTKLDELPQFWNVLRGDMSLVGPRPEVAEYVRLYPERYRRILTVRPGITDLASIAYRNEESVLASSADPYREYVGTILPAKLSLAEEYLSKRSVGFDFLILLRTFWAVLR